MHSWGLEELGLDQGPGRVWVEAGTVARVAFGDMAGAMAEVGLKLELGDRRSGAEISWGVLELGLGLERGRAGNGWGECRVGVGIRVGVGV